MWNWIRTFSSLPSIPNSLVAFTKSIFNPNFQSAQAARQADPWTFHRKLLQQSLSETNA